MAEREEQKKQMIKEITKNTDFPLEKRDDNGNVLDAGEDTTSLDLTDVVDAMQVNEKLTNKSDKALAEKEEAAKREQEF